MLSVNNCTFSYERTKLPTIEKFSLQFSEGGVYGLLGSNGAGKSTLLQLIAGLLTPDSGDVTLDGTVTRKRLPETLNEIFLVPEETYLPAISLRQFVRSNSPFYPNFSEDELYLHLQTFGIERDIVLDKLSMGQKKKVALAFAMACNTKVVMMDEPTNGLDIPGKSAFRKFIAETMSDNRIFIISTHQVRDVGQILDHVTIINNRKVLFNQTVFDIETKLCFADTMDKDVIDSALYAEKGIGGASVILPNNGDEETEINLELLYGFATENPEKLNEIFSQK